MNDEQAKMIRSAEAIRAIDKLSTELFSEADSNGYNEPAQSLVALIYGLTQGVMRENANLLRDSAIAAIAFSEMARAVYSERKED